MRSLSLITGFCSLILVLATSNAGAAGDAMQATEDREAAAPEVSFLLQNIERMTILHDADDCGALSPVPLYADAPSLDAWETYCRAVVEGNARGCDSIPASMTPDLRTFCFDSAH